MQFPVASSPHLPPRISVARVMRTLLLALLPGVAVQSWLFGWGTLINLSLAIATAVLIEAAILRLRQRPVAKQLADSSAIVTAVLLVLALPPLANWWLIVIGVSFAMVFGKHVYGGLGFNPFNPAMVGYVVLLISFPTELGQWPAQLGLVGDFGFIDSLRYHFTGVLPAGMALDGITSATALAEIDNGLNRGATLTELLDSSKAFGVLGANGWEWVALAYLFGGVILLQQKIIRWQIPATVLGSLAAISLVFWLVDAERYASPLVHIFSGGVILGAFFIATDPVSASTTVRGRLYFGAGIGLLIWVIRSWGGYPDGVAFAVLLMNICAPLIDHYTQPRVYGHGRKMQL